MNEPTDTAIDTLILEHGVMGQAWPTQRQLHAFARAVHAKWGNPAPVAGEPVAWLSTDSIGERYLCFTKPNDSDPVRPLVFGDTTPQPTQAQAGAVPLTDEFVTRVVRSKQPHLDTDTPAWEKNFDECKYWLEAASDIAGGQHGAEH